MASHRRGACLVACRADPSGRPLDRPTVNRGARPAPLPAWIHRTPYRERYKFIPLNQISPDLQHAVVAAEDARFYQHHRLDWHEVQIAAEDDLEGGRTRGASTITQQLVKNLFFGTGRLLFLRKGARLALVPVAEFVLGKRRILEIYFNVVNGALVFMVPIRHVILGRTAAPNIGREPAAGARFCRLPGGDGPSA